MEKQPELENQDKVDIKSAYLSNEWFELGLQISDHQHSLAPSRVLPHPPALLVVADLALSKTRCFIKNIFIKIDG